jgi:hypothetical protein
LVDIDLGVVDVVPPQGVHDGRVRTELVSGDLDALTGLEPRAQVREEGEAVGGGALAHQEGRGQLGVGVDGNPGPDVAVASVPWTASGTFLCLA